jgi:hypothetical protein
MTLDIEEEKETETIIVEPLKDPVPARPVEAPPEPVEEPEAEPVPAQRAGETGRCGRHP